MTATEILRQIKIQAAAERRWELHVAEEHLQACKDIVANLSLPEEIHRQVQADAEKIGPLAEQAQRAYTALKARYGDLWTLDFVRKVTDYVVAEGLITREESLELVDVDVWVALIDEYRSKAQ